MGETRGTGINTLKSGLLRVKAELTSPGKSRSLSETFRVKLACLCLCEGYPTISVTQPSAKAFTRGWLDENHRKKQPSSEEP
jgi:hypothetical protein